MQVVEVTFCADTSRISIRPRRAFSLVELVIVVVVVAIFAAIAVARFGGGSRASEEAALRANLMVMRNAIDLYAAEHDGSFPSGNADGMGNLPKSAAAFVNHLTLYSDRGGKVSQAKNAAFPLGPYLRAIPDIPVGPNKGRNTVAIDKNNSPPLVTGGSEAWVYGTKNGEIIANTDQNDLSGTRKYNEY